jgi:hypothetical protein
LTGWNRSSVVQITVPLPAAGGRVAAGQWLMGAAAGAWGAWTASGARGAEGVWAEANAGRQTIAKMAKILEFTAYKQPCSISRALANPECYRI